MKERNHFGRWLVIGIVTLVALAIGVFVATRPLVRMRVPRVPRVPSHAGEPSNLDPGPQSTTDASWVEGDGTTTAPDEFPVKVNERSGIYHLAGDLAYDRTISSRNYRTAEAAEADGFRHALR